MCVCGSRGRSEVTLGEGALGCRAAKLANRRAALTPKTLLTKNRLLTIGTEGYLALLAALGTSRSVELYGATILAPAVLSGMSATETLVAKALATKPFISKARTIIATPVVMSTESTCLLECPD